MLTTSVYISNSSIQTVTGSVTGNRFKIKEASDIQIGDGCIINGIITDAAALKEPLEMVRKKNMLKNNIVRLTIDGSSIITKLAEVPMLKDENLYKYLNENFQDIENKDKAVIDYMVLEPINKSGGATVLATLVENDFLSQYVELFSSAGLKLDNIDISLACSIRYTSRIDQLKNQTFILTVFDKNTVMLALFVAGKYRFSKRVRVVSESNSDEMYDELSRMLVNLIQFNKSEKTNHDITNIYFGGFLPPDSMMYSHLADSLGVEVSVLPEPVNIKCPQGLILSNYIFASGNLI